MQRLRFALLGCGGIAKRHAKCVLASPEAEIVAGCDVSADIVERFYEKVLDGEAAEAGERPAVYDDAARMYAEAKPDAVVISTPHTLHYEQGVQALEAGCHVMMEKPMVTSAEHAYRLRDLAEESGRVFVVGYNTPCTPTFHWLREQVRTDGLGRLEVVSGYLSQGWMRGTSGKWRQDPALSGGGQAYDSGAHILNSLTWTVESPVEEVFSFVDNHGTPVDINSVTAVRFRSGVMASIAIAGNSPGSGRFMVFVFERGRVEIDGWSGGWIRVFGSDGKEMPEPPVEAKGTLPVDNLIDAIRGRDEPRAGAASGVIHTEFMDAIYESARTGRPARPERPT